MKDPINLSVKTAEICCGTTCNKGQLFKDVRCQGAEEFRVFIEANIKEDCSEAALVMLLERYIDAVQEGSV